MKDIISAVVIDDNQDDVWAVTNALGINGIPAFPIHYTEAKTAISLCAGVADSQPRIIITDIQIQGGAGMAPSTQDYSNVAKCIEKLTLNTRGPYIVMAWTDQQDYFDELKTYIEEVFTRKNLPLPFYFGSICKNTCKDNGSPPVYSIEKIFDKLMEHFEKQKQVKALMHWEKMVLRSAHETVNTLIITSEKKLKNILCALGNKVAGEHLKDNESIAVNEFLIYILRDELSKRSASDTAKRIWKSALNPIQVKGIEKKISSEKFKLNTLLHIDALVNNNTLCPGDVLKINDPRLFFKNLTIESDTLSQIKKFKDQLIISKKDSDLRRNIKKEKHTQKRAALVEKHRLECTIPLKNAKNSSIPIVLEISPQCDFSNKKKSLKSLVLGLLIPADKLDGKNIRISDSNSEIYMPVFYDGTEYFIAISAKYILSLSTKKIESTELSLTKIFRVREDILQSWIQEISFYNSRLGTISFH